MHDADRQQVDAANIKAAIEHLVEARRLLGAAGASRAKVATHRAIKSADGAARHARNKADRSRIPAGQGGAS